MGQIIQPVGALFILMVIAGKMQIWRMEADGKNLSN